MNIFFIIMLSALFGGTPKELSSGDKAPNFTAVSTDGTRISLHDYLGKSNVVLYFYPGDMTKGCTIEACKFRDELASFKKANTVILGVSLDSREKHQEFTKVDSLNFPLLVDSDSTICRAYGVPVALSKYASRWTFLIGKDGKIVKVYKDVNPKLHSLALLQDIWAYNKSQKATSGVH
jgi:thioredoxin-dependent peroxiredoxin